MFPCDVGGRNGINSFLEPIRHDPPTPSYRERKRDKFLPFNIEEFLFRKYIVYQHSLKFVSVFVNLKIK